MTDTANANDIIMKGLSNETEGLGRFGHHPNPAIDFCIEVETLESRLHQAEHGLSKPRSVPETIAAVLHDIQKALNFRVGGDEGAVSAKHLLRSLEDKAKSLILTDTANAPERAFEFNTQGKAPSQKTKRIPPGLYTVSWKDGGTSEVAIGMTSNGDNWMAPTNWLRPAMIHSVEGDVWGSFERLERINATHCDELVAAAYLDAIEIIRMLPELILMNADQVRAIEKAGNVLSRSGARTNASAALTAYGERMKAEGAKEEREKWQRPTRDTFDAMCAMRDAINEHVPMPSLESDLLHGPENSVFCATVAESVIDAQKKAQAKIARLTEALKDAVEIVHKSYVLATMEAVNAGPASPIAASHDAWRAKCVRAEEAARAALQENKNV